jgi:hypothetical protein
MGKGGSASLWIAPIGAQSTMQRSVVFRILNTSMALRLICGWRSRRTSEARAGASGYLYLFGHLSRSRGGRSSSVELAAMTNGSSSISMLDRAPRRCLHSGRTKVAKRFRTTQQFNPRRRNPLNLDFGTIITAAIAGALSTFVTMWRTSIVLETRMAQIGNTLDKFTLVVERLASTVDGMQHVHQEIEDLFRRMNLLEQRCTAAETRLQVMAGK